MHSVWLDLRYALRELRHRPGFALAAVLSLALGIGAASAVFSVIYAVLFNPFPYKDPERLVQVALLDKSGRNRYPGLSGPQIAELRQAQSVESIVVEDMWNLTTTDSELPEDVSASYVSTDAPDHWGVPAHMGRWLVPSDAPPGQEPERVVVLGYGFWQRHYHGQPDIVGRNIQLVRKDYRIVGVMPRRFRWREADVYVPLKVTLNPNIYYGSLFKIRSGFTLAQANSELQPILERFAKTSPDRYPDAFRTDLRNLVEQYAKPLGPRLYLLFGAVASLLLIGCANVSILLLSRGVQRQQELAVRGALGAGRSRIVRQLLTESVVIAAAGVALGILFAWRCLAALVGWIPADAYPAETVIAMNLPVLLFSIALAILTSLVFGISPALQLSRPDIASVIRASTRRLTGTAQSKRTHSIMVGAQVALTLLVLTAAAAAAKGFLRLMHTQLGYDPRQTMSVGIPVHENSYQSWKERSEYFERIRARIAAMPQVEAAAISTNANPPSNGWDTRVEVAGRADAEKPVVRINFVSPDYFAVLRVPLMQGRVWNAAETARAAPMVMINQTMARQLWPDGSALGRRLRVPDLKDESPYAPAAPGSDGWMEVIGIAADATNDGIRAPIRPAIYVPFTLRLRMFTQILVRTRVAEPLAILRDVRSELTQIDRDQQIMRATDLEQRIAQRPEYSQQRLIAVLFGIFSCLALLLAAAGLYSVVSYGVATRMNELGIRVALGGSTTDILRLALGGTLRDLGIGLAAGAILCITFDSLAARWLTESPRDPLLLASCGVLLLLVAVAACWVPARRAYSVDPMVALRSE